MNEVKVISGKYRGQVLSTPGNKTHPMGAREKLALFNMIADFLPGALVLDAFAGSGALGIEAISRGAERMMFIEKSQKACQIIRQNLQKLAIDAKIFTGDVVNFTTSIKFDVILADPPYDDFDLSKIEQLGQFLKQGGILVLSHPQNTAELSKLELLKTRKYANATISIYVKR